MRLWLPFLTAIALSPPTFGLGQSSSVPPPSGSVVAGQVIDATTREGVGGAQVTLSLVSDGPALEPSNSPGRLAVTTADGRYVFQTLRAGRYSINVSKDGTVR